MGTSFMGDIALDDVIFSKECTFNGNTLPGKIFNIIYYLSLKRSINTDEFS